MEINWSAVTNSILDLQPDLARDPLLHYHNGVFHCYYSGGGRDHGNYCMYLDEITSVDLVHWSDPRRLVHSGLGFSSPGNIIKVGEEWVMCVQTYPIPPGKVWADETARLWYMKTTDFKTWTHPIPMKPQGAEVNWTSSHRQIDPCFIEHDGRYWCLYKGGHQMGLLVSDDFQTWTEASPDRPVLGYEDTVGGVSPENPCVVRDGGEFVMVYSPCATTRGLGIARSKDLFHWYDVHELDLPFLPWAAKRPTAGMITDMRDTLGKWIMVYHGEHDAQLGASLGIGWSEDLEHWTLP